ncbi:hypothetical protein RI129_012808 [Pyrocoelia pectoralis]|uniref:Prostaglandin reductase 1 n=1 Tax=Pyrocoelia pectoralis TaxID=417401 RepID=A0AAN7ZGI6_9COLE
MVKTKKFILKRAFEGFPKASDVQIVEEELPPIKDGEFLAEAVYLSVDAYMRGFQQSIGEVMMGTQIAKITESKLDGYPIGKYVIGSFGWRTHTVSTEIRSPNGLVRDYEGLPISLGLSALGISGCSAYFGLLEICKPQKGETVVVSGAGGAVGSHAGQIAKIIGCTVIGILGDDRKGKCVTDELGFDYYINYKKGNLEEELAKFAPSGVDCYFDNVGGEISNYVISQMNRLGRICVCGFISHFNDDGNSTNNSRQDTWRVTSNALNWKYKGDSSGIPKVTPLQSIFVIKELRMEGFVVYKWASRWNEALEQNLKWIKEGKLKCKETITEGFENTFAAFVGLLQGQNLGKALVKI